MLWCGWRRRGIVDHSVTTLGYTSLLLQP
ncbi:hypothetical protein E2C01_031110 [Portunus trituberculatus]|uniref:Uncharacterized protein n=1 Tax=Portunus trituberculatus TaxID=210409 RepID=A0A5B7EXQ4_PORTR|nr:hypothetical protein [Portunus trituberculatus]